MINCEMHKILLLEANIGIQWLSSSYVEHKNKKMDKFAYNTCKNIYLSEKESLL